MLFHVKIHPNSVKYTSFVTYNGQFEYLKMSFGLKNSPANFSRYVQLIYKNLIGQEKNCMYFDDILIPTETVFEHLQILHAVFDLLVRNYLELRLDIKRNAEWLSTGVKSVVLQRGPKKIKKKNISCFVL